MVGRRELAAKHKEQAARGGHADRLMRGAWRRRCGARDALPLVALGRVAVQLREEAILLAVVPLAAKEKQLLLCECGIRTRRWRRDNFLLDGGERRLHRAKLGEHALQIVLVLLVRRALLLLCIRFARLCLARRTGCAAALVALLLRGLRVALRKGIYYGDFM